MLLLLWLEGNADTQRHWCSESSQARCAVSIATLSVRCGLRVFFRGSRSCGLLVWKREGALLRRSGGVHVKEAVRTSFPIVPSKYRT